MIEVGTSLVPSGREFHRVLAGEHRRVGRGVLAIVLLLGGMLAFSVGLSLAAARIDATGVVTNEAARSSYTPTFHAAAMLSVALLIPWSMAIQRLIYGLPAASLHSVTSRFRFDLFGRALMIIGPAWVVTLMISDYLVPEEQITWSHDYALWMFGITLLLTPLQAAGEEYGVRGLVFRVTGSWARSAQTGLILGVLASTAIFAAIHASTDAWLNIWYAVFAVGTALITWRTGGVEVAVVIHALYNSLSFLLANALRTDLAQMSERSSGAADIAVLVPCVVIASATVVVWYRTRRSGGARTPGDAEGSGAIG